jgi:membrane protease YdiL (CAAX protease family)
MRLIESKLGIFMTEKTKTQSSNSIALYGAAFLIFSALLALREIADYAHIYDFLPIMGRTTPYMILTLLLVFIYKLSGHSLRGIGWRLPTWKLSRPKVIMLIMGVTILIIVARLVLAVPVTFLFNYLEIKAWQAGQTVLLAGNLALLLTVLPVMVLAVISEELLVRGFIMNFIANKFGGTRKAWIYAIVVSSILFGIGHFPQGPRGMIGASVGGLVYATAYYLVGRSLVPGIIGHAIINTIGFFAAYSEV